MLLLTFKLDQVAQGLVQMSFEYANDGDSTASLDGLGQPIGATGLCLFVVLKAVIQMKPIYGFKQHMVHKMLPKLMDIHQLLPPFSIKYGI